MLDDKQVSSIIRRIGLKQRVNVGFEPEARFDGGLERGAFQHS